MKIENEKIINLFQKYNIEGFVNIYISNSKSLEYSPLYDEISFDSIDDINTSVSIIKKHKKSVFLIDGYSLKKIENAISNMLNFIDYAEYDEDIILPKITDSIEKDFSNNELENVSFDYLKQEGNKFINYKFHKNIKIESFSIGVNYLTHIFINSFGSIKTQKYNLNYYYMEIFGENNNIRDNHSEHILSKKRLKIKLKDIKKLEQELLFKIGNSTFKLEPGIYDITLDNDIIICFLNIILRNMQAESIREGISLFSKNKIGDKIFSSNFTLINNPNLKNYTGSILFDKEGITVKKTILFENGILKSKFFDYKNALKEGLENLGNSIISNIELIGETTKDYLIGSKFLFTNLMAFHTIDESTGKFSLNGEGYLIIDGEKKNYIKNISLSGDIISLFSNIKYIGNDFKKNGNFKVPSITFKNQKII